MNIYITVVTCPIFDKNICYCIKKLYFLNFFPPRWLFSLLRDEASTASFLTKNTSKKSYSSPAIQSYHWDIFMIFFEGMKNQQKISLVFCKFQMALVYWFLTF